VKGNTLGTGASPVVPQTWYQRTAVANGKALEFSCSRGITAVKEVTVRTAKKNQLLRYQGFELSYVFDFVQWQGQLVFATGNGLYASKPASNEIQCLPSEPDLLVFRLCPLDEQMYIGASNELYRLGADLFLEMLKKAK